MGVDFKRTFGAGSDQNNGNGSGNGGSNRADQPKAKVWLNIGYVVDGVPVAGSTTGETESRFVSLPVGIPLDTMEMLPTNSRNQQYAQFQAARNSLHGQLMAKATELKPGEDFIIGLDGGLAIQVRRVADERENIVADAENPFAIELKIQD